MRSMRRAEVWARQSWVKILLHCCWLCGLDQVTQPLWALACMSVDWKVKPTLQGCQNNWEGGNLRPPEHPGEDSGSAGPAWALAPWLLLISQVQLKGYLLSEAFTDHSWKAPCSSHSLSFSIASSGLFPFRLEIQSAIFLFVCVCLLSFFICWSLAVSGHNMEVTGGRGLIHMCWDLECLTHSRWLEYLTKDPCKQGKILSLAVAVIQSLSHVRLFATPWSVACQAPLSKGISQARKLEQVAISFSRGFSWSRDWTQAGRFLITEPAGKPSELR